MEYTKDQEIRKRSIVKVNSKLMDLSKLMAHNLI